MTESKTWTEEHVLASDLWAAGKSMGPMSPEEELEAWRKTTRALDSLCGMATGLLLEPLELALADALGRAREEERRAEDRLTRPEGAQLGPREKERLLGLLRRSGAFGMGMDAYEHDPHDDRETREETIAILREAHREANEQFCRYRAELGLPERPGKKNTRKPA